MSDFALRQRPLELIYLAFSEVGVEFEPKPPQLRELCQSTHIGDSIDAELKSSQLRELRQGTDIGDVVVAKVKIFQLREPSQSTHIR